MCYVCGPHNPDGLHVHFEPVSEREVVANVTLPAKMQGWRGFAHGGTTAMLIDEAMAHAVAAAGYRGVSAEFTTRFRHPVPLETPLVVQGEVEWMRRSVFAVRAKIIAQDGTVLAQGEGKFVSRGPIEPNRRLGQ